jgi:hypothetical protein
MSNFAVKTVAGGKRVIHTAVFQLRNAFSFEIHIDGWSCTVRFKSDGGGSRYLGSTEGGRLYIDLYNHDNALGDTIADPFVIAGTDVGSVYMTYTVSLLNPDLGIRRVEYTLWMDA